MSPPLYPADFQARRTNPSVRRRNPRLVTVPERACAHVKLVFEEMRRQQVTYDAITEGSGVQRASMKAWRIRNYPSLQNLRAALGFLGWDYVPVPSLEILPAEIAGDIVTLARKMETSVPELFAAAVSIGVEQRILNQSIAARRAILAERDERKHGSDRERKRPARLQ